MYIEFVRTGKNYPVSKSSSNRLAYSVLGIPVYTLEGWKTPLWQKLYDINPHEYTHGGQEFWLFYDQITGKITTKEEAQIRIAVGEIEAYTESIKSMEKYLQKLK